MAWITLISLIVEALIKLPDLIEAIKKIFDVFSKNPRAASWAERGRCGAAIREALAKHDARAYTSASCPLTTYADNLAESYAA